MLSILPLVGGGNNLAYSGPNPPLRNEPKKNFKDGKSEKGFNGFYPTPRL